MVHVFCQTRRRTKSAFDAHTRGVFPANLLFIGITLILAVGSAAAQRNVLDQYGGITAIRCTGGAKPHFYPEQIGNRWWICDPAGNGFL